MTQYDAFEQNLTDSLQSTEMPSGDFSARVMAQMAKTPQVRADSSKRTWKIVLTAAACFAVVAVAVPMVFFGTMRAGSAAPVAASDCAAPAETEEAAAENEAADGFDTTESPTVNASTENEAVKQKNDADSGAGYEEISVSNTELCQQAREVLSEMGLDSDSGYYSLTAEQGMALQQAMPELKLPVGAFVLILEE